MTDLLDGMVPAGLSPVEEDAYRARVGVRTEVDAPFTGGYAETPEQFQKRAAAPKTRERFQSKLERGLRDVIIPFPLTERDAFLANLRLVRERYSLDSNAAAVAFAVEQALV